MLLFFKEKLNSILIISLYIFPILIIIGPSTLNIFSIIFSLYAIINYKKFITFDKKIILIFFSFLIFLFPYESIDFKNSIFKYFSFLRFILMFFGIQFFLEKNFKKKKFFKLLNLFCVILLLIIIDVLIESFTGTNLLGFKSNYVGRVASFTNEELIIGYIFCFIALFTLLYIKKKVNNWKFLIIISILISVSFLIGERSNFIKFLSLLFTLLILDFALFKRFKLKSVLFLFIGIFLAIFLSLNAIKDTYKGQKLIYLFSGIISINENKLSIRINEKFKETSHFPIYYTSYEIFKNYPLFGIGINNFFKESQKEKYKIINNKKYFTFSNHPHQTYLEILAEVGLFGLIYFLLIFFYPIYIVFKIYILNKEILIFSHFLLHIFFIFPILPSGSIFGTNIGIPFWFNLAVLFFLAKKDNFNLKKIN